MPLLSLASAPLGLAGTPAPPSPPPADPAPLFCLPGGDLGDARFGPTAAGTSTQSSGGLAVLQAPNPPCSEGWLSASVALASASPREAFACSPVLFPRDVPVCNSVLSTIRFFKEVMEEFMKLLKVIWTLSGFGGLGGPLLWLLGTLTVPVLVGGCARQLIMVPRDIEPHTLLRKAGGGAWGPVLSSAREASLRFVGDESCGSGPLGVCVGMDVGVWRGVGW